MIEDSEIAKFSAEKQIEIKEKIKQWVERGYSAQHLALDDVGGIYLERDSIESEAQMRAKRGDFDKK